jgi:hypothetical protein
MTDGRWCCGAADRIAATIPPLVEVAIDAVNIVVTELHGDDSTAARLAVRLPATARALHRVHHPAYTEVPTIGTERPFQRRGSSRAVTSMSGKGRVAMNEVRL